VEDISNKMSNEDKALIKGLIIGSIIGVLSVGLIEYIIRTYS